MEVNTGLKLKRKKCFLVFSKFLFELVFLNSILLIISVGNDKKFNDVAQFSCHGS